MRCGEVADPLQKIIKKLAGTIATLTVASGQIEVTPVCSGIPSITRLAKARHDGRDNRG